jgi:hypothetical protein
MESTMSDASLLEEIANRGISSPERKQLQRIDWLLSALEIFVGSGLRDWHRTSA